MKERTANGFGSMGGLQVLMMNSLFSENRSGIRR